MIVGRGKAGELLRDVSLYRVTKKIEGAQHESPMREHLAKEKRKRDKRKSTIEEGHLDFDSNITSKSLKGNTTLWKGR